MIGRAAAPVPIARPARRPMVLAAAAVLLVAGALVALGARRDSGARAGSSSQAIGARAEALADAAVASWAARERPDGRFPDAVASSAGDYGSAMLGTAMLRRGVARRSQRLIRGGLAALRAQADAPSLGGFELLAIAEAFVWADRRLPSDPLAAGAWAAARQSLARYLGDRAEINANPATLRCFRDRSCYGNQKLVGALATATLLDTGLAAAGGRSILSDPVGAGAAVAAVAVRATAEVGAGVARPSSGLAGGGILSDPPRNPLAYHALSVAMLARLQDELLARGRPLPPGLPAALERAGRALVALAAPDGDLSYFGRGQGQVWVPAVTVDAAAQLAVRARDPALRGQALALAGAALHRLELLHREPGGGFSLVPLRTGRPAHSTAGVDAYASARSYNGLAVDALDHAAAVLRAAPIPDAAGVTAVPASADGVSVASAQAGLATITRGAAWLAVATHPGRGDDARYGPGLLALRSRDRAGIWRSSLAERPLWPHALPTIAIEQGGETYVPDAAPQAGADGRSIVTRGGWSTAGSAAPAIELSTHMRWSLAADGAATERFRLGETRTIVARAIVDATARMRRIPGGIAADDGRSSRTGAARWSLTADGRPLHVAVTTRRVGASAYSGALRVLALRAVVPAGAVVELAIAPQSRT